MLYISRSTEAENVQVKAIQAEMSKSQKQWLDLCTSKWRMKPRKVSRVKDVPVRDVSDYFDLTVQ
jgi:hypothetical protein